MFDAMFVIVPVVIGLGVIYMIVTGVKNWSYNKSQPKVAAEAFVVTKRINQSTTTNSDNSFQYSSTYYVTFEFTTSDRKEFVLSGSTYGMLAEGDKGILTFQGNNFIGFERKVASEPASFFAAQ